MKNVMFLFSFISFLLVIAACSENNTEPELQTPTYNVDGFYYLEGEKIVSTYSAWPIPEGDVPAVDTLTIGFTMNIEVVNPNESKIRFYGLFGADGGSSKHNVFPGCTQPNDCIVYGTMLGVEEFEVIIENGERSFLASGRIRTVAIAYEGEFTHKNVHVKYILSGDQFFY